MVFAACLLSCSRGGRTIPADKLADIYVDMLILDQFARNNSALGRQADTSLVYEPIIRRHGYTVDEYIRTVEDYLQRPDDFAKVFETVRGTLQARADYLTAIQTRETRELHRRDSVDARTDYRKARIFSVTGDPTLAVRIELDSAGIYSLERILPDTLYEGLFLILRDTLAVDTLSTADSLVRDSLRSDSLIVNRVPKAAADSVGKPEPDALEATLDPAAGRPVRNKERPLRATPVKESLKRENEANIRKIPVPAE